MAVTVALVDDHAMFRESLSLALAKEGMNVVGGAEDVRTGFELLRSTVPDVAVVDIAMPGVSGLSLPREISRNRLRTKVLVLTMHLGDHFAGEAFAAGAHGFARKTQRVAELVDAIRTVARGERYVPPDEHVHIAVRRKTDDGPLSPLSRRERDIFDLVVQGNTNKETAKTLFVSVKTVETHRANINRKLHVHSTAELMRFASMHGLVR